MYSQYMYFTHLIYMMIDYILMLLIIRLKILKYNKDFEINRIKNLKF